FPIELMSGNIALFLLIGRSIETLRHMAGLAGFAFFRRLGGLPISNRFRLGDSERSNGMAGEAKVRFFEQLEMLRVMGFAFKKVLVTAEHRATRLQFDRRMPFGIR